MQFINNSIFRIFNLGFLLVFHFSDLFLLNQQPHLYLHLQKQHVHTDQLLPSTYHQFSPYMYNRDLLGSFKFCFPSTLFTLLHVYFSTYFIVPFLYVTNFASLAVGAHTRNFVCCGVYIFPKSLPP